MSARYTAYIFDLDGTLTRPGLIDFDAIKAVIGCPRDETIIEYLRGVHGPALREAWATIDRFEAAALRNAAANHHAYAVLDALHRRGAQLFVLTRNSRTVARATLLHLHMRPYITDIVCREDAEPKPDPAGIKHLLTRWSLPADRTLMVGDFRFDVVTGAAAGVDTAFLTNRRTDTTPGPFPHGHPTHTVGDLRALLRL